MNGRSYSKVLPRFNTTRVVLQQHDSQWGVIIIYLRKVSDVAPKVIYLCDAHFSRSTSVMKTFFPYNCSALSFIWFIILWSTC